MTGTAGSAAGHGLIACHTCGLVSRVPTARAHLRCPRCGVALHARIPRSLSRTWAFLVAAVMLYLPANLVPIMHVTSLGQTRSDTILSGAEFLLAHGMWPLALIVFVASVLVPVAKIAILGVRRTGSISLNLPGSQRSRPMEKATREAAMTVALSADVVESSPPNTIRATPNAGMNASAARTMAVSP